MSLTDDKRWILEQLKEQGEAFDSKLSRLSEHFDARLERVETTLLTEFHKWASPMEMRVKHTAVLRTLDIEREALADCVKKIEDEK